MELRLLRLFVAVAETGTLVTAARQVHLTPSAISHSLKGLETELGCRLFERVGKRMVLNQAGEQLLAQIKAPIAALETAASDIKRLGKWGRTRLRLAAPDAWCQHMLPRIIRDLKKNHASIELHVRSTETAQMLDLLRENKADLGVGVAQDGVAGFELRPVFRDEVMFVFASSHAWADGSAITADQIRSQPFIVYQPLLAEQVLDDHFRELHIAPKPAMEVDSVGTVKELVKLNLGISVLAPWMVDQEIARRTLRMRPLPGRALRRQWNVFSRATHRMTLAEETFCRLCRNHAAGLRLDRKDVPAPMTTGRP